jgi:6-phosphogluconate dehydrogenase
MKIGYIGLGKMGGQMVLRLLEQGIEVVAWNRSPEPLSEVVKSGAVAGESVKDLASKLNNPRVVWLMLPQGAPTDEILQELVKYLEKGDLVIDGANAFYRDSIRRATELKTKGIRFMDMGVSGGPGGARSGACLMVGGEKKDYEEVIELVKAAAAPESYGYFGKAGAGHFVKMVHNGIEYGMMEAVGEGAAVLKSSKYDLDLAEIFRVYNKGSVIQSRLVGWAREALDEDSELSGISSVIDHTGEGEWTIKVAGESGVDVPVIKKSLDVRINSGQDLPDSPAGFRNKVVSVLRGKFGRHDVASKG